MYEITKEIPYLYHSTTSWANAESISREGLKSDSYGLIYLAEKPIPHFSHAFKVKIPKQSQLMDWREAWYDDEGNEIDMDHQYDESNPYYLYLEEIGPEYLELVKGEL